MAAGRSDEEIDALLAAGRLGGPVRDRIFDAVATEVGARAQGRRAWVPRWSFALGGLAAAAAAIALFVVPRDHAGGDGMRAKGVPGGAAPALELACAGGTLAACPVGSTLLFAVGEAQDGFLAAYAEPRPAGERVWYFSADGAAPAVHAAPGLQPAGKGIRIGPEHAPGDYVVHVLLTRAPRSREEVLRGPAASELLASRDIPLTIVPARGAAAP
jgi:hypothetical protein